jgi:membrane associated rhomboid family serine protease
MRSLIFVPCAAAATRRAALLSSESVSDERPLVEVFRALTPRACDDRALVLEAVGVPAVIQRDGATYALLVPEDRAASATLELARYARENLPPPRVLAPRLHGGALLAAAAYVAVLFACGVASSRALFGIDWYDAGILDARAVRAGEIWRAVTALTLHADLAHFAANAGFGALFGGLAARLYGPGRAWLVILAAATCANLANAATMPAARASLGASTAVFAALGALGVYHWPATARRARLAWPGGSLVAALVLLALLGTGDERTDIVAHAFGFGFGALLALPLSRWLPELLSAAERLTGLATLLLVACAWLAALLGRWSHGV